MAGLSPESLLAIQDATKLAFHGIEFETVLAPEVLRSQSGDGLISGSGRIKDVFDTSTGRFVEITEGYLLGRVEDDKIMADHTLDVAWDDGTSHVIGLDDGEIIGDDSDPELAKAKVIKALGAATSIVL